VPQSAWFTRVLLYWDDVGAIVPYEFIEEPDRLGPYMVALLREQLVQQVIPSMHLWRVNNFQSAFLDYVDRKASPHTRAGNVWPKIHMEKLQGLGEELCERGLARRARDSGSYSPWFEIEPETAGAFMAYLAAVLGQMPGESSMCPVTDQPAGISAFAGEGYERKALARMIVLEAVLPGPEHEIEPARLAEFKAKHQRELTRLRNEIENTISELSLIDDDTKRDRRQRDVAKYLRAQVEDLVALMREERKWPRINLGTLSGVGAAAIGSWQAIVTSEPAIPLAGTALGLLNAVYSAVEGSGLQLQNKPMAYAALIQRTLA
jgi:hypothetical protein